MKPSDLNLKLLPGILMALTGLLLVFLLLPAILDDSAKRSAPGGTLTLLSEAEVTVDGETTVLQLPGSVDCKAPRTQVTLTFRAPADTDSFMNGLLEYPQYSRPEIWRGKQVPPILLSGDHAKVDRWRKEQSLARTRERRPDLYRKYMEEHPEAEGGAKGKKSR